MSKIKKFKKLRLIISWKAENKHAQKGRRGSKFELLLCCVKGEYDICHVLTMTDMDENERRD
ncbi:hypothetical protein [Bacillus sp. OK048]|uniref:hypothetical protein n=1 Tax=Bacillus sp. OK048 TaxID=1882761 RepID=UPI0008822788|nr:hypothetical protein [Bacillus sp. OK048]SDM55139.1 hypothetical protein SAMN05443253_10445 [Bacillus sp. OK048]